MSIINTVFLMSSLLIVSSFFLLFLLLDDIPDHQTRLRMSHITATRHSLERVKTIEGLKGHMRGVTYTQLLSLSSSFTPTNASDTTVLLQITPNDSIKSQLEALLHQTIIPTHISIYMYSVHDTSSIEFKDAMNDISSAFAMHTATTFTVEYTNAELRLRHVLDKVLQCRTKYAWVILGGVLPGTSFLHTLLHTVHTLEHARSLLGSSGTILPGRRTVQGRDNSIAQPVRYPDAEYGVFPDRAVEVDYLSDMWFMESSWALYFLREVMDIRDIHESHETESMLFSYALRKHIGVCSWVLPSEYEDSLTWGDLNMHSSSKRLDNVKSFSGIASRHRDTLHQWLLQIGGKFVLSDYQLDFLPPPSNITGVHFPPPAAPVRVVLYLDPSKTPSKEFFQSLQWAVQQHGSWFSRQRLISDQSATAYQLSLITVEPSSAISDHLSVGQQEHCRRMIEKVGAADGSVLCSGEKSGLYVIPGQASDDLEEHRVKQLLDSVRPDILIIPLFRRNFNNTKAKGYGRHALLNQTQVSMSGSSSVLLRGALSVGAKTLLSLDAEETPHPIHTLLSLRQSTMKSLLSHAPILSIVLYATSSLAEILISIAIGIRTVPISSESFRILVLITDSEASDREPIHTNTLLSYAEARNIINDFKVIYDIGIWNIKVRRYGRGFSHGNFLAALYAHIPVVEREHVIYLSPKSVKISPPLVLYAMLLVAEDTARCNGRNVDSMYAQASGTTRSTQRNSNRTEFWRTRDAEYASIQFLRSRVLADEPSKPCQHMPRYISLEPHKGESGFTAIVAKRMSILGESGVYPASLWKSLRSGYLNYRNLHQNIDNFLDDDAKMTNSYDCNIVSSTSAEASVQFNDLEFKCAVYNQAQPLPPIELVRFEGDSSRSINAVSFETVRKILDN